MIQYGLLIMLCIASHAAVSANVINGPIHNTTTQNTINTSTVNHSHDWGLNAKEWKRYLSLMQGVNGYYYSHLTPPEILGINADNDEDLRYFAEIHAKNEHEKIERELRFNAAFQSAASRLFSNEPIIRQFDFSPYMSISN